MTREELLKSPTYWTSMIQDELYRQIESYMKENHMNKAQLAEHLSCSRGYVTQLLSGEFDHKLSKLVELSLAIGKVPQIEFEDLDTVDDNVSYSGCTVISFSPDSQFTSVTNIPEKKKEVA